MTIPIENAEARRGVGNSSPIQTKITKATIIKIDNFYLKKTFQLFTKFFFDTVTLIIHSYTHFPKQADPCCIVCQGGNIEKLY